MNALDQLRAFARYQTHGGYRWAAVTADGELLCEDCVRGNYGQVYRATKRDAAGMFTDPQWCVVDVTNSGESEQSESCAHCQKTLWEHEEPAAIRCDSCELLSINGIACHESGCPNAGARYDADSATWVKQYECRECGSMIDQGENCSCFESTGDTE